MGSLGILESRPKITVTEMSGTILPIQISSIKFEKPNHILLLLIRGSNGGTTSPYAKL